MLPPGSAAVDVTTWPWPTGAGRWTVNVTLFPTVLTEADPRKCFPSPWCDGSHAGLEKNNRRNVVLAVLFNVPLTVVVEGVETADVTTGKFWRLLGPVSPSFVSLGVTPTRAAPRQVDADTVREAECAVGEDRVREQCVTRAVRDRNPVVAIERDPVPQRLGHASDGVGSGVLHRDPVERVAQRRLAVDLGADPVALDDGVAYPGTEDGDAVPRFAEITLPAPGTLPPMTSPELLTLTPSDPLPTALVPVTSVPM